MAKKQPAGMRRYMQGEPYKIKRQWEFPPDFILIIDTREQKPLFVKSLPKGLVVVRDTLKAGDYSVRGLEHLVFFERKEVPDAIRYVTTDHQHTIAKVKPYLHIPNRYLMIEGTEEDMFMNDNQFSTVHPEAIRNGLVAVEVRCGYRVYYHRDRKEHERFMLDRMLKIYQVAREIV